MELPSYVQIEPVGQCNLRCTMCPIQFRKDGPPHGPPAFMDYEAFRRLIAQFPTLRDLHLQGLGEPMMHPRFFDMVAFAAARGVTVTTNTNMTLLDRRRAERLVTCGLTTLHVSLDGATAATYEAIRVRGRFDRVLRNISLFLEARRRFGREAPRLHIVMVAMRRNLEELPDLVRLSARFEANQLFVQHLCHEYGEETLPAGYLAMRDFVEAESLLGADRAWVEDVFARARAAAAEAKLDIRLPRIDTRPHPAGTPGRERCSWPWTGAYIAYDGRAMPCCMVSTPERQHFGSVFEQGVEATWNGTRYEAFRRALDSGPPPGVCQSCALYKGTF